MNVCLLQLDTPIPLINVVTNNNFFLTYIGFTGIYTRPIYLV